MQASSRVTSLYTVKYRTDLTYRGRCGPAEGVLQDSYGKAGLPAEIEVYEGALHGWCPPDSSVYNEFQTERAWSRLLTLFDTALG